MLNHMKTTENDGVFEFWFRKEYMQHISDRRLKCFVRPEVRLCPADKCTNVGDIVNVRVLDVPGTPTSKPVLNPYVVPAIVKEIKVKKICEMDLCDFEDAVEDASSIESLVSQLERIYNRPFTKENTVTVFKIAYIES